MTHLTKSDIVMPEFIERLKGARVSLNVFDSARGSILQNLTEENLAYIHTQHPELARLLETDAASAQRSPHFLVQNRKII